MDRGFGHQYAYRNSRNHSYYPVPCQYYDGGIPWHYFGTQTSTEDNEHIATTHQGWAAWRAKYSKKLPTWLAKAIGCDEGTEDNSLVVAEQEKSPVKTIEKMNAGISVAPKLLFTPRSDGEYSITTREALVNDGTFKGIMTNSQGYYKDDNVRHAFRSRKFEEVPGLVAVLKQNQKAIKQKPSKKDLYLNMV